MSLEAVRLKRSVWDDAADGAGPGSDRGFEAVDAGGLGLGGCWSLLEVVDPVWRSTERRALRLRLAETQWRRRRTGDLHPTPVLPLKLMGSFQVRQAIVGQKLTDPDQLHPWFLRGSAGFEIVSELAPQTDKAVIDKIAFWT